MTQRQPTAAERDALAHACRSCGASPQTWCVRGNGWDAIHLHADRWNRVAGQPDRWYPSSALLSKRQETP